MAANAYRFETRWRIGASREEVFRVLTDAEGLARWWPAVHGRVEELARGRGERRVGRRLRLSTHGWLPYRLVWTLTVERCRPPALLAFRASGDFEGEGAWRLTELRDGTLVRLLWEVRTTKPLLRHGSLLLRPLFAMNHRWAMARGRESLELELARRRGEAVPPPPRPVPALRSGAVLAAGIGALGLTALAVHRGTRRLTRRSG